MPILKMIPMIFMVAALSSCGGGSGDVVSNNNGNEPQNPDEGVSVETVTRPLLGTGEGSSFKSGTLQIDLSTLSAGGTTNIAASLVDGDKGNTKVTSQKFKIEFHSVCADQDPPLAKFSRESVETSSGEVSVAYTAKGCSGDDIVSFQLFSLNGANAGETVLHTATQKLNVIPPEVGGISFVESSASALSLSSIANPALPTSAEVTFKVVDKNNNPILGKEVTFSLIAPTGNTGGVFFPPNANVVKTDQSGLATVVVNTGTVHTVVAVKAEILADDGVRKLSSSSQYISVTTGIARQDRFSLSASVFNPGAFNVDNVPVEITATSSDLYGNPIPDGTVINFTAESGVITSYCETVAGSCTATWRSGGERPQATVGSDALNRTNDRIGMTTILAYTQGEAGYTDANGNGVFDDNEPYVTYGEPFRDDDYNGTYRISEFFVDSNLNSVRDGAPSEYQGALCSDSAKGLGHCARLMDVRDQLRIVQSVADSVRIRIFTSADGISFTEANSLALTPAGGSFYVLLQDANYNMPASGTTLNVKGDGYKIYGGSNTVRSSIGDLTAQGISLAPAPDVMYGELFHISYYPDGILVNIEVAATSGKLTVQKLLQ